MTELAYRFLLHGIVDGAISAGEALPEQDLAVRLHTSPAALREAIAQLSVLGIATRATSETSRLVEFTQEQAHNEAGTWAALHGLMLTEIWPHVWQHLPHLTTIHHTYEQQIAGAQNAHAAVTNFEFFAHLRAFNNNPSIHAGVTATAYRLVLARPLLGVHNTHAALHELHTRILHSIHRNDLAGTRDALTAWSRLSESPD